VTAPDPLYFAIQVYVKWVEYGNIQLPFK